MTPPSTGTQLIILVLLVLPGASYLFARERLLGPREAESEPGNRLLRLIAIGALLDGAYLAVAGPALVRLVRGDGRGPFAGIVAHPRPAGLTGLLLVIVIPVVLARAEATLVRRRRRARYEASPTAWDAVFRDLGSSYIRVRLKDGGWAGGWYGSRSAASAYPAPGDLFLESQHRMAADGTFGARMDDTRGVYVKAADIDLLEIHGPPEAPDDQNT